MEKKARYEQKIRKNNYIFLKMLLKINKKIKEKLT
jgi:hypothetical protein